MHYLFINRVCKNYIIKPWVVKRTFWPTAPPLRCTALHALFNACKITLVCICLQTLLRKSQSFSTSNGCSSFTRRDTVFRRQGHLPARGQQPLRQSRNSPEFLAFFYSSFFNLMFLLCIRISSTQSYVFTST